MEVVEEKTELILKEFLKLVPEDLFQGEKVNKNHLIGVVKLFREITESLKIRPYTRDIDTETYRALKIDSSTLINIQVNIPYSQDGIITQEDFNNKKIYGTSLYNGKCISVRSLDSTEDAQEYTRMLQEIVEIKLGIDRNSIE